MLRAFDHLAPKLGIGLMAMAALYIDPHSSLLMHKVEGFSVPLAGLRLRLQCHVFQSVEFKLSLEI